MRIEDESSSPATQDYGEGLDLAQKAKLALAGLVFLALVTAFAMWCYHIASQGKVEGEKQYEQFHRDHPDLEPRIPRQ